MKLLVSLWLLDLCQRTAVSPHSYGFWFFGNMNLAYPATPIFRVKPNTAIGAMPARAFTRSEDRIPEPEERYMIHRSVVLEPNVELRISS